MRKKSKTDIGNLVFMFIVMMLVYIVLIFLSDYVNYISALDFERMLTIALVVTFIVTLLAGRFRFQKD